MLPLNNLSKGWEIIDTAFLLDENYVYVRSFLIESDDELSLDAFLNLLCFKNNFEPGSNKYNQLRNHICDFEMVLASIYNLDYGISLTDVLFFLLVLIEYRHSDYPSKLMLISMKG